MAQGSGKCCRYQCHLLRDILWCEANGLFDIGLHYAQLAGNVDPVGRFMVRGGMRQQAGRRSAGMVRMAGSLGLPRRCRGRARSVAVHAVGKAAAAAAPLDAMQPDGSPLEARVLTPQAARAQDVRRMSTEARRAVWLLSLESQWWRNATATLGLAEYYQGNLDAAGRHPARSAELGVSLRGPAAAVVAVHEQTKARPWP